MGIVKEMRDVFDIRNIPPLDGFYAGQIGRWKDIYTGYCQDWHDLTVKTVAGDKTRRMASLNAAKALCAELSGLVFNEVCAINVSQTGNTGENLDLQGFIDGVLRDNGFFSNMQGLIEKCFAYGGAVIKAWVEDGQVKLDFINADDFIPLSWNSKQVTEGIFLSRERCAGAYFTRVERHFWDDGDYIVKNELYRSDSAGTLGSPAELAALHPGLESEVRVSRLEKPMFVYFKPNIANNLPGCEGSPLGISVFANALDTLKALDICFDSFTREFSLGKKRIIVPASAVRTVADQNGELRRYFDASDEVYQAMAFEDPSQMKIIDNTIELRVSEHVEAINALLSILAFQTGLSAGALSFDNAQSVKTATEVISENSKTFKTVKSHKNLIEAALVGLVDIIMELGRLYDILPENQDLQYETSVMFDDSIVTDRETEVLTAMRLVRNGLQSRHTTLVKLFGYTAEQASEEIEKINREYAADTGFKLPLPEED